MVTGFFSDCSGVGRAARLTLAALRAAGLDPVAHDARDALRGVPPPGGGGVWLLHCNAPEAEAVLYATPPEARRRRRLIGYWTWETMDLPRSWIEAAADFEEIWAPSEFVAERLRPHVRKLRVMPHPVPVSTEIGRRRHSPVTFLTTADARSDLQRKNPLGAVEAFRRAFPREGEAARLVVKLLHADIQPAHVEAIRSAAAGRSDISIVERRLSDVEMSGLMRGADVLLSMHRAEGFGLTIAEAMAEGVPVIATGWSANAEFAHGELRDCLVDFKLTPVANSAVYATSTWAEPNLDHAAILIRRLAADPDTRERLGAAGRAQAAALSEPWTRRRLDDHAWIDLVHPPFSPPDDMTLPAAA